MNTQDIRQEDLDVETEVIDAVETTEATLQIQTGVKAGEGRFYTPIHALADGASWLWNQI